MYTGVVEGLTGNAGHILVSTGGGGDELFGLWFLIFSLINKVVLIFTGGRVHFLSVTNPEVCLFR